MIILARDVESWLRVTRRPLYQWHTDGSLPRQDSHTYDSVAFDRFLAACAVNYKEPPTAEDFVGGRLQLLTPEEAQDLLGVDTSYFRFLSRLWLPHLKFPGVGGRARYGLWELQAVRAAMTQSVHATEAGYYLGHTTQRSVVRAVAAGEIIGAPPAPANRKAVHVYWPSFVAYLQERLPDWVTVEQWVEDCRQSGVIAGSDAAEMLALDPRSILHDLEARQGRYVHSYVTAVPIPMVSLQWVAEQLQSEPVFHIGDVARMFGVSLAQVAAWRADGLIRCPIDAHPHPPEVPFLQRPCWLAYFRRNCSSGYERAAMYFVDWRRTQEQPPSLLTASDVAAVLGRDTRRIIQWAQKGKINGIQSPDGTWLFDHRQVRRRRT